MKKEKLMFLLIRISIDLNPNLTVSCNFLKFMSVIEGCHDQIIRIEDYFFSVGFLKSDLLSTECPSHCWLLYFLTVFLNELF